MTRRSRTGYFIFLNTALIDRLSKKPATIEGSVFGAELVAMKTGVEALIGISTERTDLFIWRQHVRHLQYITT